MKKIEHNTCVDYQAILSSGEYKKMNSAYVTRNNLLAALVYDHQRGFITTSRYYDRVVEINTSYGTEFDLPGDMQ